MQTGDGRSAGVFFFSCLELGRQNPIVPLWAQATIHRAIRQRRICSREMGIASEQGSGNGACAASFTPTAWLFRNGVELKRPIGTEFFPLSKSRDIFITTGLAVLTGDENLPRMGLSAPIGLKRKGEHVPNQSLARGQHREMAWSQAYLATTKWDLPATKYAQDYGRASRPWRPTCRRPIPSVRNDVLANAFRRQSADVMTRASDETVLSVALILPPPVCGCGRRATFGRANIIMKWPEPFCRAAGATR